MAVQVNIGWTTFGERRLAQRDGTNLAAVRR
jgi:hypothetical protein